MGMSTRVIGIKPPGEKWKKMKAIWDACEKAEIEIPDKVDDFFDSEPPDDKGVVVEIPIHECGGDMEEGYEVYLDELSKDIEIIRFVNSW